VTAVQTRVPPTTSAATGTEAGPVPRRVRPPRWLDLRLVLGVLLVLGSVLLGARVVSAAATTVPVWAAAGDLAAGTVLTADDLVTVDVRLDDSAGAYLAGSTRPAGRTLSRAVRHGELLPRTALASAATAVQVALPVQAGFVPPDLRRGQLVDVYAVSSASAAASTTPTTSTTSTSTTSTSTTAGAPATGGVTAVVQGAPVQAVAGRAQGVLSAPTTTVQVVVTVPADRAAAVLAAIGGRPLAVVVHGSVEGPTG
jgi:hypothetical protein